MFNYQPNEAKIEYLRNNNIKHYERDKKLEQKNKCKANR